MQDESGHLRKKIYILAVFNNHKCQKKRSNQPVQQQWLHMQNVGKTLYSGNDTESELQEYWNETLFTEKATAKMPWDVSIKEKRKVSHRSFFGPIVAQL